MFPCQSLAQHHSLSCPINPAARLIQLRDRLRDQLRGQSDCAIMTLGAGRWYDAA